MLKKLKVYVQYLVPQHVLSRLLGWLANCHAGWLTHFCIRQFMRIYHVDLSKAEIEQAEGYTTFNQFFTRALKSRYFPDVTEPLALVSPSEGKIAQIGNAHAGKLLQAKNSYFTVADLLGDKNLAQSFQDSAFATIYLAPNNYHRVHMPLSGTLLQSIFIPGKLFSVNQLTAKYIPNLYSRNERLVCFFATEIGLVAIILVGAMIVGSIQTVWEDVSCHPSKIIGKTYPASGPGAITLAQSAELGRFKLGSTVIMLLPKDKTAWLAGMEEGTVLRAGEKIGEVILNAPTKYLL